MRGIRWLPVAAAMAAVALTAPSARAQEKQATANGSGGAAASVDPLATQAAIDVLKAGGNAFDAAVAAASVLGVVEPYSCGIGGGGFMVIRDGKTGDIKTIDSREKSPAAMVPSSFFIDGKAPTDAQFSINRYSGLSAGVPGTPYAWSYLPAPLRHLRAQGGAAYGIKVARQRLHRRPDVLRPDHAQRALLRRHPVDRGDLSRRRRHVEGRRHRHPQPGHGQDLRAAWARAACPRASTRGPVADAIVKASTHRPRRPRRRSLLAARPDDQPRPRALRDQGPRARRARLLRPRALRHGPAVLRRHDRVRDAEHHAGLQPSRDRRQGPAGTLYHFLEASRLAYADRNKYLGDPSFVRNPIEGLLSNEYAATRAALIGDRPPPAPVAAGTPPGVAGASGSAASVDRVGSTTHLSVADKDGNIVAYTFTIESTGGNGVVVPGYGFLLNNELTDFDTASVTAPNRPEGNKRPRSSISPVIVTKNDRPFLTIGSPGGATIITTVGQTLVNRINLHMPIQDALAAPRASQRNSATTEAESAFQNRPVRPGPLQPVRRALSRCPPGTRSARSPASSGRARNACARSPSRSAAAAGRRWWSHPVREHRQQGAGVVHDGVRVRQLGRPRTARSRPRPRGPRRRGRRRCRAACRRSPPCARAATADRRRGRARSPATARGPRHRTRSRRAAPRSSARRPRGRA